MGAAIALAIEAFTGLLNFVADPLLMDAKFKSKDLIGGFLAPAILGGYSVGISVFPTVSVFSYGVSCFKEAFDSPPSEELTLENSSK